MLLAGAVERGFGEIIERGVGVAMTVRVEGIGNRRDGQFLRTRVGRRYVGRFWFHTAEGHLGRTPPRSPPLSGQHLAVSRRTLGRLLDARSDSPAVPELRLAVLFSSLKTLAVPTETTSLRGNRCPGRYSNWPVFR